MKRPIIKSTGLFRKFFPENPDSTLMQHVNPRRVRLVQAGEYPWVVVRAASDNSFVWRQRGVRIPKPAGVELD